jgi:hypothetical protein
MVTVSGLADRAVEHPRRWVLAIVALSALLTILEHSDDRILAETRFSPQLLRLMSWAMAPLAQGLALAWFFLSTRLDFWVGRALGGRASWLEVRAASGWSRLPWLLVALPLLPLATLRLLGDDVPAAVLALRDMLELLERPLGYVRWPVAIYGYVVYLALLARAQGFSVARAFFSQLLGSLLGVALAAAGVGLGYAVYRFAL